MVTHPTHLHLSEYTLPTSFTRGVEGGFGTRAGMVPVRGAWGGPVSRSPVSEWDKCLGGRRSKPGKARKDILCHLGDILHKAPDTLVRKTGPSANNQDGCT